MYALDKHTRIGQDAIRSLVKYNSAIREFLERHVVPAQRHKAAYMAAFYADAAPLASKLSWDGADRLEALGTESDLLKVGVPSEQIEPLLKLFRANVSHLNKLRAHAICEKRGMIDVDVATALMRRRGGRGMTFLTRDNPLLSSLKKIENPAAGPIAVVCTEEATGAIADLVRESLAPNTRAAYLADLAHFEGWGGRLPAEPETVAAYLATHADALSVATLNRRLAALAKVHRSHGMANPTSSELVKSVLRGLKRLKGTAQRQAKPLAQRGLDLGAQRHRGGAQGRSR